MEQAKDISLYVIKNDVSGTIYYGISCDPYRRMISHRHSARNGKKTPLYSAMRSYGEDKFSMRVLYTGRPKFIRAMEIELIANDQKKYNLHPGGDGGYLVPEDRQADWKRRLSASRQGKKPFKGKSHTEETKAVCGEHAKKRWDGKRASDLWDLEEILSLGFAEANRRYGIPKTTYYRARRSAQV